MKTVAIIPARGGSKGIKDKNLQRIGGLSLVARAIRAANGAASIDEVYVSTDSAVIADEAIGWGARVVDRPSDLSGDLASSESAIMHALGDLDQNAIVVFIQCTSPFTSSSEIEAAVELIKGDKFDSVFSAVEDHGFRWEFGDATLIPVGHSAEHRPRRQDLPARIRETGAFYAFRSAGIMQTGSRFHGRIGHVLVDQYFSLDIDTEIDLKWGRRLSQLFDEPSTERKVSAVVLDFDGVQTDDYVWIDQEGKEFVRVSRSDGHGISMLKESGIRVVILSSEKNPVVRARAEKLDVEVMTGHKEKSQALSSWAAENDIKLSEIAFLGNDTNDISAMKIVGLPIAVCDAQPAVVENSAVVLKSKGGEKAVRELAGYLLEMNGSVIHP